MKILISLFHFLLLVWCFKEKISLQFPSTMYFVSCVMCINDHAFDPSLKSLVRFDETCYNDHQGLIITIFTKGPGPNATCEMHHLGSVKMTEQTSFKLAINSFNIK